MKLILLQLLSLLCLSHQKGEISKGAEDVKNFIEKAVLFRNKIPITIKVNEKNIINIGKEASSSTPGSLSVTANRGEESIIFSNSSPGSPENVFTLDEIVDQLKDLGTGLIQPTSKISDVEGVEEARDSLVQAGQASISAVSNSADEIIQQPLVKSEEILQKSSAIVTGTDTEANGEQKPISETLNSVITLPKSTIPVPLKIQTITDESEANQFSNGLSPAVSIQYQLSPSIQQANPTKTQLQASVTTTTPIDVKPKQIYTESEVNQIQQTTSLKPNKNNPQTIQFSMPQIQIPVPQFQNGGFMFGNIFNLIPTVIGLPQIQQVIPQFMPPILPKVLTPILPPVVSNILFPMIPNHQERNNYIKI